LLTINALAAADSVVIPMQAHFLALQGMAKLLETVQLVQKRMNPKLKVGGLVLTMFDGQAKLSHEVIHELENFITQSEGKNLPWTGAKVFETRIRRNIKLAESPSFGQPIFDYDPASNGAIDYQKLAKEMLEAFEKPASAPEAPASNSVDTEVATPAAETAASETPDADPKPTAAV
jgi:chromosome partitioning protein